MKSAPFWVTFPSSLLLAFDNFQIGFMNQRCRSSRLNGSFTCHLAQGDFSTILVEKKEPLRASNFWLFRTGKI